MLQLKRAEQTAIYVLLSDTGTMFTKTVKQFTQAPYNHASICFDEGMCELYSFGRKKPHNPLYGGFVREDVCLGTYRYFPQTTCAIYKIEVTRRTVERTRRVIRTFKINQKKYRYNIAGLLGILFNYPIELATSYFCSQFVAEVLKRAGMPLWDKSSALVTPDDFRNSPNLELVYEGKLFDYEPIKERLRELKQENPLTDPSMVNVSLRKELLPLWKTKVLYAYYTSKKIAVHGKFMYPKKKHLHKMIEKFSRQQKFEDYIGKPETEKEEK